MKFLVLLTVFCLIWEEAYSQKKEAYCRLFRQHTVCVKPVKGPSCKVGYQRYIPNIAEATTILKWHNEKRSLIANGSENVIIANNSVTLPLAKNMLSLSWDPQLARIAQRHADQCDFRNDCALCRGVVGGRFASVGQVISFGSSKTYINKIDFEFVFDQFYAVGIESLNIDVISSYSYSQSYERVTQVIWANTRFVGCGASIFIQGGLTYHFVVCNYGPAGNINGESIYEEGKPCTACPLGTACANSSSLCD